MNENFKLYMLFKDRIGIVADVSALIARNDLSIKSMEVEQTGGKAKLYVEIENGGASRQDVFKMLGTISDLEEFSFIEVLPQQVREKQFRVVLDNIRDGVFSIDTEGKITTINRVAATLLGCEAGSLIGKHIKELPLSDYDILECLSGKKFTNVKREIVTSSSRIQFFSTCRPIVDSKNRISGAVEIDKDVQQIKLLAQSISEPAPVTFSDFLGQNHLIREATLLARKIAATDSIVTIRGESGTGKDIFARAIHSGSGRKGPFIPINCAALPENLLESELFGYVSGAFTGATKEGKPGLFEMANGGTIFLDEIGEMPLGLQAKLLRAIEEKSLRRVGGTKEITITSRIITATNENLEQMLTDKLFRKDLYYRINVLPIHIAPLRERLDDIPLLVDHFLFQLNSRLDKAPQTLTRDAMDKLCAHDWPGNVRELKNVIERASILCESDRIDSDYILFSFEIGKTREELQDFRPVVEEKKPLRAVLDRYEKQMIRQAIETSASLRAAAKSLGISHTGLLQKIRKHGLEVETKRTVRNESLPERISPASRTLG
ncbi:MAG: sigma-54 interaction domain-containing protein [Syntrophobacteraceae bacterium]